MSIYIDPASSSLNHVTSDSAYRKLTKEQKGCFYIQTSLSSWRWCNLDVPGSCHVYLYILHFFFVCVDVYVVQLMQVTTRFLTLYELICESSKANSCVKTAQKQVVLAVIICRRCLIFGTFHILTLLYFHTFNMKLSYDSSMIWEIKTVVVVAISEALYQFRLTSHMCCFALLFVKPQQMLANQLLRY